MRSLVRSIGPKRARMGHIDIDAVTFEEALDRIEALVLSGRGGSVYTPNVDHIVTAEEDPLFRAAYASVSLSLADGQPLVWASRLLGPALPERVAGSDLILPLMERAARRGWGVYLIGGGPAVGERAAENLRAKLGVRIVGVEAPRISIDPDPEAERPIFARIAAADPEIILVALGAPKQELFIERAHRRLGRAVLLGIGAGLDFIAATVPRAPRWMARAGLEWLYRLSREPRRLWRRYLVHDARFAMVLARDLLRSYA